MNDAENMMSITESDDHKMKDRRNAEETMDKNEKEQNKLRLMRALVERQDPSSKVCIQLFNFFCSFDDFRV